MSLQGRESPTKVPGGLPKALGRGHLSYWTPSDAISQLWNREQPWCSLNLWGHSSSVLKNNTCSQAGALWSRSCRSDSLPSVILSPPVHTGLASAGGGARSSHPSSFLYRMVVWPHPYGSFPEHTSTWFCSMDRLRAFKIISSDSFLLNKISTSVHLSFHFTINKPRFSCKTFLKISPS